MNSFSWLTTRILDSAESSIKTLVSNMAPVYEDPGGEDEEDPTQLGITPELVEFVLNICSHPNTFKDFPTSQLPSYILTLYSQHFSPPLSLSTLQSLHSLQSHAPPHFCSIPFSYTTCN
jgi:hypothetical protein